MIRKFKITDLDEVMNLWLTTNIEAHSFIPKDYWVSNFNMVKNMLPSAEIYVYIEHSKIHGFIGIDKGYIAGIFVSHTMQSKGIGKNLLDTAKELYPSLSLSVYKKNTKAIGFYKREQFTIIKEQVDKNTGENEYLMEWER